MGLRGPAPTPTPVLARRGSRKVYERKGEPTDVIAAPPPPEWLAGDALTEWRRIVPLLLRRGTIAEADLATLAAYCQSWAEFVASAKYVSEHGYWDENGKPSAAARRLDASRDVLIRLGDRLGLSPAAKSRVTTNAEQGSEAEIPTLRVAQ